MLQEVNFKKSLALDLIFHVFPAEENHGFGNVILALGMENGSVSLYYVSQTEEKLEFVVGCSLLKHEDWVRCLSFVTLRKFRAFLSA